jgi:thiamine-phosphate pyrophosphorylase
MSGGQRYEADASGAEMLARLGVRSPVYFITPSQLDVDLEWLVEQAIAGGVGMVQLRLKECTTREFVDCAAALLPLCRREGVPLIVNDRADVCLAVGADGVHVGQEDLPVEAARMVLGPASIIGATTQTPELARQAAHMGASYVAVGPMFASPTKPDKHVIGPRALTPVRRAVRLPVCAIGGITEGNIREVIAAGADLAAVVTAISEADDPAGAAAALVAAATGTRA